MTTAEEHAEWNIIKNEKLDAGLNPSAFDVSEEQRRRHAGQPECTAPSHEPPCRCGWLGLQ